MRDVKQSDRMHVGTGRSLMSSHSRIVPACVALLLAQSPAVHGQEALNAKVDAIFSEYARADSPG